MNFALKLAVHVGLELALAAGLAYIGVPLPYEVASAIIMTASAVYYRYYPKFVRWKRRRDNKKLHNIERADE